MRLHAFIAVTLIVLPATTDASSRDSETTVHAVRVDSRLRIDGQLDEPLYREVEPLSDFIQIEPEAGAPARERTEVWVGFDADHVYVAFRVFDAQMDRLVATEMRRDNGTIWAGNDVVVFAFDTFHDRRSSVSFTVNAIGGRMDGQVINERQFNADWNPVWELKTGRFEGGWTMEAAVPFKSLRYTSATAQVWGFNAMRVKRATHEISTLARVPPSQGAQGVEQPAFMAILAGIEAPARRASFDVKPYVTSNLRSDLVAEPHVHNATGADIGIDAKVGLTQNLTADLTYNTDFAQVEADQQQVNLSRFSLFFPEKREFFLENQGVFSFGGVASGSLNAGASDAPILFYSRRIGLSDGGVVPLRGGGRLTGRAGRYSVGVLNIRSDDDAPAGDVATSFTVARVKRDILRRSSIGAMMTHRSAGVAGAGSNRAYGVDVTLGFFENLQINTYWARTATEGRSADAASYRTQLAYAGDRYGVEIERLAIGRNFNPEIGFVRRDDMVRDFVQFRFSPRPQSSVVRKYVYQGSLEYIEDGAGRLETRRQSGEFAIEFRNADRFSMSYTDNYEFLPERFRIGNGVVLPIGGYAFANVKVGYNLAQHRAFSANVSAESGRFYSGHKRTINLARGRFPVTSQLSVEPTYSLNDVDLVEGRFTTHLAGSRVTYTFTPLMFVSALVQYNSGTHAVSTNARLRWEYRPGSELFIVYNDERNTLSRGLPSLNTRAVIVKVNRLLRF